MSLAAYLAKNYLTADPPSGERPNKKRKKTRQHDQQQSGLVIADDDPPDLRANDDAKTTRDDSDDGTPTVAAVRKSAGKGFRNKSKTSWTTIGGPAAPSNAEQVEADAILASAAAERKAQQESANDGPTIETAAMADDNADDAPRMESGARAGLQTAADTAAMVEAQERKRASEAAKSQKPATGLEGETIYRDASGRIINVAMKRAEARRAAEEAAEKEAAEKEALTGDVQRREKAARREALEEAKYMPVARTAEDEEMNSELKARQRWNDPAAQFMSVPEPGALASVSTGSKGLAGRKKTYQGAAPPNRYGIRPGHRWDGVDRGNGFEHEWFATRNKRDMRANLEYAWAMDE